MTARICIQCGISMERARCFIARGTTNDWHVCRDCGRKLRVRAPGWLDALGYVLDTRHGGVQVDLCTEHNALPPKPKR